MTGAEMTAEQLMAGLELATLASRPPTPEVHVDRRWCLLYELAVGAGDDEALGEVIGLAGVCLSLLDGVGRADG